MLMSLLLLPTGEASVGEIRYRNPYAAMAERYNRPVEISIHPSWKLTGKQLNTAIQPPIRDERGPRLRFIYPEDIEPSEVQVTNGYALTKLQRQQMRRARRQALQKAAWQAGMEAEKYNRVHSSTMESMEKQGLHLVISLSRQQGDACREIRSFAHSGYAPEKFPHPRPRGISMLWKN